MARQLRIEYEGAFYHVTSRGNQKEDIFFDDRDRERFLEILKRTKDRYRYLLHAYCLMRNHYHLLLETPQANLSQVMQNINTSYTVYINKRHGRFGHLFQGRFKAIIVDKEGYLLQLSRYIHLNPVRSGITDSPMRYKWSSYHEFFGSRGRGGLIEANDTLSYFSKNRSAAIKKYREFVEAGTIDDRSWLDEVKAGAILGREEFIESIKRLLGEKEGNDDIPSLKRLTVADISVEKIIKVITEKYGEDALKSKKKLNIGRDVGIYLCRNLTGVKNIEIGRIFGIKGAAVSIVLKRIEKEIDGSRKLRREFEELKSKCRN